MAREHCQKGAYRQSHVQSLALTSISFITKYPDFEKNNDGYVAMKLNEAFFEKMKTIAAQREKEQTAKPDSTSNKEESKGIVNDLHTRRRSSVIEGPRSVATKSTNPIKRSNSRIHDERAVHDAYQLLFNEYNRVRQFANYKPRIHIFYLLNRH